jgi:hypothetical protein
MRVWGSMIRCCGRIADFDGAGRDLGDERRIHVRVTTALNGLTMFGRVARVNYVSATKRDARRHLQ